MKKLRALVFYALVTPAVSLGSAALAASHHGDDNKDVGEQDMDKHAQPENQNGEFEQDAEKSKYNSPDAAGMEEEDGSDSGDHSDMKKEDGMESSSAEGTDE
ncbi:hypothetical protein LPB19_16900 [Marinobacter salinisoli]|uniref:Pentapeptide MXKDX repeat protein n=1 Tax=Marinobacter salinisoli TaxID=2769486 RepID=A0ABX7MRK4_9GAMM|nr:hypothetical protein [Marinobacter salinisoli]QSP94823.1 hypothetical protein LPB19_16900 [Marinobacter salinisoli]